ncbi:type II toxin-antitoxin system death-on-curing family toxin [Variovorax sp. YR216]|uniref:type II toxin-antitoxin system death-on-curing family toxin n=1 Tax=Variovorax sp. YR216 TaxID=1882828 RepID=UPI0008949511|nr:type II toxin-antitoxin system death-on-curing family toxin [Variovorax sp. YR216]SEA79573.1 death on curing protein [Variovorax sp. YR216]
MTAANESWTWLSVRTIQAAHDEQLAEHGGPGGLRDEGLLASALARPQHRALYDSPDAAALAASYAFGIARNHPFVDGNKRTAFVALELFLDLNGYELDASDEDCVFAMLGLAAGQMDEDALAAWVRTRLGTRSA